PYVNKRHWWRLPRRIEVARLFNESHNVKSTQEGYLALPVSYDQPKIKLKLPGDADVFRVLLHAENWFPHRDVRRETLLPPTFQHSRFSNDGRYLIGALRLFGDLWNGFQVVSCRFWRRVMTELGAPSRSNETVRLEQLVRRLRARLTSFDNASD